MAQQMPADPPIRVKATGPIRMERFIRLSPAELLCTAYLGKPARNVARARPVLAASIPGEDASQLPDKLHASVRHADVFSRMHLTLLRPASPNDAASCS